MGKRVLGAAVLAGSVLVMGACGDDDDGGGELAAYCDFGATLDEQEDFPSDDQLEEYRDLAPAEISEDVDLFIDKVLEEGEAAFQSDDEDFFAALERIEAFDEENCGRDDPDTGDEPAEGE